MKKDKDRAYKDLDNKLQLHLENSMNAVAIDEDVKDRIWNNLYNEIQEEKMKRKFIVRKKYRVGFAACIVLLLVVSMDLSTNASLFKRLITTVNDNVIVFHSRGVKLHEENRDEELDNKIDEINEKNNTGFISPVVPDNYNIVEVVNNGIVLDIHLKDENENMIAITERDVSKGESGTTISYDKELFEIEVVNNNGVEYTLLKSSNLNVSLFVARNIEFEIIGNKFEDVFDISLSLQ